MATPNTYGLTSVIYGNPALSGFVVQSSTVATKTNVVAEVFNETGERVHVRYDDITNELTLDMIVNGGSIPVPGSTLTYNTVVYEIVSSDVKSANKDFEKVTVKCKNSEHLSLG